MIIFCILLLIRNLFLRVANYAIVCRILDYNVSSFVFGDFTAGSFWVIILPKGILAKGILEKEILPKGILEKVILPKGILPKEFL